MRSSQVAVWLALSKEHYGDLGRIRTFSDHLLLTFSFWFVSCFIFYFFNILKFLL